MGDLAEFEPWPKIPRLSRGIVVTEKIDGTNAAVVVRPIRHPSEVRDYDKVVDLALDDGSVQMLAVYAQSRKRIITPECDNFGFARWVHENAEVLARGFGVGRHFGEWWGNGIQRGYGVTRRYFSPFNVARWRQETIEDAGLPSNVVEVPIIGEWPTFDSHFVDSCVELLELRGSQLRPVSDGTPAEGVIVYHTASEQTYKRLLKDDHLPKSLALAS